jgi:hypothetical protein
VSCFLILHLQTSLSKLISIHFKVVLGGLLASWSTRSKTSDTARCSGQAVGKPDSALRDCLSESQSANFATSVNLHTKPLSAGLEASRSERALVLTSMSCSSPTCPNSTYHDPLAAVYPADLLSTTHALWVACASRRKLKCQRTATSKRQLQRCSTQLSAPHAVCSRDV